MFGMFFMGLFCCMMFNDLKSSEKNSSGGGLLGGILGALTTAALIKTAWKELTGKNDKKDDDKKDDDKKDDENKENTGEDKSAEQKLIKNKSLSIIQKQIKEKEGDTSKEANQLREMYDSYIKCAYDEDGNERDDDAFKEEWDKLPEEIRGNLEKNLATTAKDKKVFEEFNEKTKEISAEEAAAASELAKADRIKITKREKEAELDKQMEEELRANEGNKEEQDKITDKFKKKKEELSTYLSGKISEFEEKAKKLFVTKDENKETIDRLEKENAELNKEKESLANDTENSIILDKYDKFEFKDGIEPGNLKDEDKEKKENAEKQLKDAGLSIELYNKIQKAKYDKDVNIKEKFAKELKSEKEKRISDIDKKIAENTKTINNTKNDAKEVKSANTHEPQKTTNKKEPKMDDTSVAVLDDDGEPTGEKIIKKEDGSFKKVDKDGKESDATKDDWKDARSEFQDSDWDGDEENSKEDNDVDKDLDNDSKETDDEKNSEEGKKADRDENGKRVNPAKNWHKRKKKNGGGSTKSYYNSKGDSISAKEFREKMENYKAYVQKHKKSKPKESFNISNYLKDKLIVERFYPRDISSYLKEHLR